MIVADASQRWSFEKLLSHPWIVAGPQFVSEEEESHDVIKPEAAGNTYRACMDAIPKPDQISSEDSDPELDSDGEEMKQDAPRPRGRPREEEKHEEV